MFFPFMIDVQDKHVVVIGGGSVALHKCRLFLDFGAKVTVVSPEFCQGFAEISDRLQIINDEYREEYLAEAFVLVAASGNAEVNRSACRRAKQLGILVNAVDDPPNCSFYIPAIVQKGSLTLGISTAGKSPAFAARLRRELDKKLGDDIDDRLEKLGKMRERLLETEKDMDKRRKILIRAAELEAEQLDEYIESILCRH